MENKKKEMSTDKLAKMDLLKSLRKMAMDMINEGGESEEQAMQKVTVAAKDKEGLKKGLEKAEDVLEALPEVEMKEKMSDNMDSEELEEDMEVPAEEEDEIAQLEAKLEALKAKKLKA